MTSSERLASTKNDLGICRQYQRVRALVLKRALLGTVLALAALFAFSLFPSVAGFLFWLAALGLFVAPGIPLARRWFAGPEKYLVGAAIGFAMSTLVASALFRLELGKPAVVAGVLAAAALLLWRSRPGRELRVLDERDYPGLAIVWLITLAIVTAPFWNVGRETPDGVAYRAYFSADLMTHLSVVAELQKGEFPLQNPFYEGLSLGYYWLFFTFPAIAGALAENQSVLLATYLASGLLFSGLLYLLARGAGAAAMGSVVLTSAALAAASFEGALALVRFAWLGEPLSRFTDLNVDALSRWAFELTSLDGLHRSVLYTPQHLFSYSLLLILLLLVLNGEPRGRAGSLLCGGLLGSMAGTSIVTAMLAGPWLIAVLAWRRRGSPTAFLRDALWTTGFALLFLVWFVLLGFFGDAGGAMAFRQPRAAELPLVVLLECGGLIALVLLAARGGERRESTGPAVGLALFALAAVLFLDVRGYEGVWMAWRAGSVLLLALFLLALSSWRAPPIRWIAPIVAVASVTTILDVYNAQDITNFRPSAGAFRWTTLVSKDEWEALRWVREQTPLTSIVQFDTRAREPGEWALIPAIAERRMAVGFPIFLLDLQKYRARERRHVRPVFLTSDAREAHRNATETRIDYLIVGRRELEIRGEGVRKLFEAPELFRPVFFNDRVTVFEVVSS